MASPLNPFAQQITHQFMGYVVIATVLAGLIGLFKRDLENWIVKNLRVIFHPPQTPVSAGQDELMLDAPPACPGCRKPMVKRLAKKGLKRDSQFWGCSAFPDCRGTRAIDG